MAGPSATGNYARAGAAVGREMENLFAINRNNAPDMSSLVQNAAKRDAEKEIAAIEVKRDVLKKGIAEVTKTSNYKVGVEAEGEYKSAKRMAGLLATAGGYLGKGIGGLGDSGRKMRDVGASDSYYDGRITSTEASIADYNKQLEDFKVNGPPDISV